MVARLTAFLAAVLPFQAAAAADDEDDTPHITVRGTASARATPDLAVLRLGVAAEGGDAGTALKGDASATAAAIEAARAEGVAAGDIELGTTSLSRVVPEAAAEVTGAARPRVYRAATAISVRLRDPAKVGAVLAALAARDATAGATQVAGVDYRLSDPEALLARLTGEAVAKARRRAEAAAAAAGVRLGAVLSVEPPDEPAGGSHRVPGRQAADGMEGGTVSTTVEVSFAIIP